MPDYAPIAAGVAAVLVLILVVWIARARGRKANEGSPEPAELAKDAGEPSPASKPKPKPKEKAQQKDKEKDAAPTSGKVATAARSASPTTAEATPAKEAAAFDDQRPSSSAAKAEAAPPTEEKRSSAKVAAAAAAAPEPIAAAIGAPVQAPATAKDAADAPAAPTPSSDDNDPIVEEKAPVSLDADALESVDSVEPVEPARPAPRPAAPAAPRAAGGPPAAPKPPVPRGTPSTAAKAAPAAETATKSEPRGAPLGLAKQTAPATPRAIAESQPRRDEPARAPDAKPETAKPEPAKPEPAKPEPAKLDAAKPEAARAGAAESGELDFSALRAPAKTPSKPAEPVARPPAPATPAPTPPASAPPAKYAAPATADTTELEKDDPRHAAARRLARLAVSEIKLYHEAEVKTGREKKDLWSRLQGDIALAKQTYDNRVVAEVRQRFDYLYDEILRQLADGNVELLGADAPTPNAAVTPAAVAAPAPAAPAAPEPRAPDAPGAASPESAKDASAKSTTPAVTKRYVEPTNPETADLEKNDPRHAAARRLARLSVAEIKLYHEDEVKLGREKNDLWTRLQGDIALARQTFDSRVAADVRERFDYLYDEILKQLADGDAEKLGGDAPKPKAAPISSRDAAPAETAPSPRIDTAALDLESLAEPATSAATTPEPAAPAASAPSAPASAAQAPSTAAPAAAAAAPAAQQAKPTMPGVSRYVPPTNPETAELEKSDPRHAAARRLARLSVSEIKLYHEDEVKLGREKKDLYTRLGADIALAKQTFEKRVDQDVRDRYDYLYDEIVRQLAEGNEALLGPDAPPKKKPVAPVEAKAVPAADAGSPAAAPPAPAPEARADAKPEPKPEQEPEPEPEPKAAPKPVPVDAGAAAPAAGPAAAPEPKGEPAAAKTDGDAKGTLPSAVAKYMPPTNPATAELEKSDPRHAAARRLARLSVSEIKLYHEDEVKAGREKKDLWSRLQGDIALAKQTYEKRVDQEVRERFDYLYDEILRQLAEGDADKLGPDAPKPKSA